jgi:hypothetical protein
MSEVTAITVTCSTFTLSGQSSLNGSTLTVQPIFSVDCLSFNRILVFQIIYKYKRNDIAEEITYNYSTTITTDTLTVSPVISFNVPDPSTTTDMSITINVESPRYTYVLSNCSIDFDINNIETLATTTIIPNI